MGGYYKKGNIKSYLQKRHIKQHWHRSERRPSQHREQTSLLLIKATWTSLKSVHEQWTCITQGRSQPGEIQCLSLCLERYNDKTMSLPVCIYFQHCQFLHMNHAFIFSLISTKADDKSVLYAHSLISGTFLNIKIDFGARYTHIISKTLYTHPVWGLLVRLKSIIVTLDLL